MAGGRITPMIPDLFSTALPREKSLLMPSVPNSTADMITRHVLPNDLPSAIKQLNDQELEQLLVAVTADQQRRGKQPPAAGKTISKRTESVPVTLAPRKLNAGRAALQTGDNTSRNAQEFWISQADLLQGL